MARLPDTSAWSTPAEDVVLPMTPGYGQLDLCPHVRWRIGFGVEIACRSKMFRWPRFTIPTRPGSTRRTRAISRYWRNHRCHYSDRDPSDSMRVIDGVHRLRATQLRGDSTIPAGLFEGNDAEAFALAVHLNVIYGLPLTLSERKAAARRVLNHTGTGQIDLLG